MSMGLAADEAYRRGRFGAWVGIAGNLLLSLIKFMAGILGHSSAMIADAVHSLSDLISSAVVLAGLRIARKLPDSEHPYGHSKAEGVSAQLVSVILIFLGGMIFLNSWEKISLRDYVSPSRYVILVAMASILLKEGLYQYKSRLGKKIRSSAIVADAWHHRSDALSSIAVLVGVCMAVAGGPRFHVADHIAAMVVAVIICFTGLQMLKKTGSELMDKVLVGPPAEKIRRFAEGVGGVRAVEKLFARKSGMDLNIDIHVEVDPQLSVREGHSIAMKLKRELMREIPSLRDVMVHVEPFPGDMPEREAGG